MKTQISLHIISRSFHARSTIAQQFPRGACCLGKHIFRQADFADDWPGSTPWPASQNSVERHAS
jgi:hypothetical protein